MSRIVPPLFAAVMLTLLGGCSSKEYYTPETTAGSWPSCRAGLPQQEGEAWPACVRMPAALTSKGAQGAVSDEGWLVDSEGVVPQRAPEGTRFLGLSDGWLLFTGVDGTVTLQKRGDTKSVVTLQLEKTVAAASVKGDLLAVLFASNDIALYTISTGKSAFKAQGTPALVVDVRIAAPYFLGNLVIFPTLDGKIAVVDAERKEVLRSTIVSSEPQFDNVFYFNVIGDTMVAATPHRIFSLGDKERRAAYDLRDVVFDAEGIWAATKEGEVLHLTPSLQPLAKRKFPFAHFLGLIIGKEKLYLLEKEGYLIVMDKAMQQVAVYKVDVSDVTYTSERAFYTGDQVITVVK